MAALPWPGSAAGVSCAPAPLNRTPLDTPKSPVQVAITAHPHAHCFTVSLRVSAPAGTVFRLPAWIRGSYLVRDFAKHVSGLKAFRADVPVRLQRLDKSSFSVAAGPAELRLEYSVYAFDESVRKAWLDTRRGFFNFSSLVYLPLGFEQARYAVQLNRPDATECRDWRVATALTAETTDAAGFGLYSAANYETLIDSPVEMAAFRRIDFDAEGLAHTLTLSGRLHAVDEARLAADMAKICAEQRRFFGNEPSMARYWFLTNVTASSYGGLEHCESTALVCSRNDLPRPGDARLSREYRTFLGLVSHEYFHLWNVKRITPKAFAESDLSAAAYTRDLWHYEGVTSYYDDLFLLRAGVIDAPTYLDLVAEAATRLERTPAREQHSLADASFETWIKYYQPDENSPNASTNYYVKGALVALLLDLKLRAESSSSLDAVMRALWARYGRTGIAAPEGALAATAAELSGLDLGAFFAQSLDELDALPLASGLARFGVKAVLRAANSEQDAGGRPTGSGKSALARCSLGLKLRADGAVAHVIHRSAAQQAGLAGGDQLLAIDGLKVSAANFERRLDALVPGQEFELMWFRGDELMRATLCAAAAPLDTWTLELDASPGAEALVRRQAWLGV